jgi:hypothetical protein
VRKCTADPSSPENNMEIDQIMIEIYGLQNNSEKERQSIGKIKYPCIIRKTSTGNV